MTFDPEEEWVTVIRDEDGIWVWQGWEEDRDDLSYLQLRGQEAFIDSDGGLWAYARPDICYLEAADPSQNHLPRAHPGAGFGYFYCVRCGAQGVRIPERDLLRMGTDLEYWRMSAVFLDGHEGWAYGKCVEDMRRKYNPASMIEALFGKKTNTAEQWAIPNWNDNKSEASLQAHGGWWDAEYKR